MPRRREFRGIAFDLLGAFMSRNNDVGGYWAVGKLYELARAYKACEVRVDLVRSLVTPPGPEFNDMVRRFRQWISDRITARRMQSEWLRDAFVTVRFGAKKIAASPANAFECTVTITDDLGRTHSAQGNGACWAHDPSKESKSLRASASRQ
jgi:hypothetical protein